MSLALPHESVAKLEKLIDDFDKNLKIIEFHVETEPFYSLYSAAKNMKKITNLLSDNSRILANIHAIRFEFTTEYQLTIYDRIKKRFDDFEEKREKVNLMQDKFKEFFSSKQDLISRAVLPLSLNDSTQANSNQSPINNKNIISAFNKNDLKIVQKTELIDLNLKTDFNERLLEEVGSNLREIDRNISETAMSLRDQGSSLKNINEIVGDTDNNINRANKILGDLSWGQRLQLIFIHLISIILFIVIIILLVLKIISGKDNK